MKRKWCFIRNQNISDDDYMICLLLITSNEQKLDFIELNF